MAPWWLTLVVAGLGLVGTVTAGLGGVIITQRASDRREEAARNAQTERERELWRREDKQRQEDRRKDTDEQRVAAYLALLNAVHDLERAYFMSDSHWDLESEAHSSFMDAVASVELYGRSDVADQAATLPNAAFVLATVTNQEVRDVLAESMRTVKINLRSWIRQDIGVDPPT